jgi:general stress protein 26
MSSKSEKSERELNAPGTREELNKLLGDFRTAILVTRDEQGLPRARPLAIQKCEADGTVWFASSDHTPKIDELARDNNVAVICHRTRDEAWISLSGRAELVTDRAKIKDLWTPAMKAWFEGPDDPAIVLIRVKPTHAEYYEPSKPFFVRAFEFVKGMVTREPPKVGTTKHVDLDRLSEPGRFSSN